MPTKGDFMLPLATIRNRNEGRRKNWPTKSLARYQVHGLGGRILTYDLPALASILGNTEVKR